MFPAHLFSEYSQAGKCDICRAEEGECVLAAVLSISVMRILCASQIVVSLFCFVLLMFVWFWF